MLMAGKEVQLSSDVPWQSKKKKKLLGLQYKYVTSNIQSEHTKFTPLYCSNAHEQTVILMKIKCE
jgi:hypothetical protein